MNDRLTRGLEDRGRPRATVAGLDEAFRRDVIAGLTAERKSLPCKWLYDERGSRLFEQICETPEYYVTRTELSLLAEVCPQAAMRIGPGADVIEPGSGAGRKVRTLLDALPAPRSFIPLEISLSALDESVAGLRRDYPDLSIVPVAGDFSKELLIPESILRESSGRRVVFFPGSTISNFAPKEAALLLGRFRRLLRQGDFLFIGVDLVKDRDVLLRAYDDAAGVTAAFNLNLLRRIRDELAADFDVRGFSHQAVYNEAESRVEMHLVSRVDQEQHVCGRTIRFAEGETIHTENSYKFTIEGFIQLARQASFAREVSFSDDKEYFSLHLLRAVGESR
jgi:dimethylhistidine N-methyltransferase